MNSINKVILIGNVTRTPEIRKTLSNETIATFGLATNREWTTRGGKREHDSEFHEVVCWGDLADTAEKILRKGAYVNVSGFLKTRSWDDSSGVKKFRTEIVAEELILLEKRADLPPAPTVSSHDLDQELQPTL